MLEKEFADVFLKTQLPNEPQRANMLLVQFAVAHKKFLNSLSLDDIERIATTYLQLGVGNLKIQE